MAESTNQLLDLPVTQVSQEEVGNAGAMEKLVLYVKLGENCVEAVQKMSLRKFNNEQCGYLADKLQAAVRSSSLFLQVLRTKHHRLRSSMDVAKQVNTFKLQLALAKQIENFVQGCCKDSWIQAAMTLTNVWEYVASIGFNLELCRVAFCMECAVIGGLTLNEVEDIHKAEVEVVKKKAFADVDTLFQKVIWEMPSLSSDNKDLACYLILRLKQVNRIPASDLSGSSSGSGNGDDGGFLGKLFKWVKSAGEQLGSGSSGTVDKAMWLGTPVAKKTFHGPENPDFMKEVEVLSPLCHPNVMSLFCCAKNQRSCSIIMELMDEDLHRLMQKRLDSNFDSPPFPILEAVDIMLQIGEGVKYLHNKRIVHRDLKSMNILVKSVRGQDLEDGYVHAKVADFGLAKTKEKSTRYSTMTSNVGTHRWMPPEVIKLLMDHQESSSMSIKRPKYPLKCDTYSFGMVCFEILTGDIPFSTTYSPNEVKKQIIQGERPKLPEDPKDCPPMLKDLIEKCWSGNPKERPTFISICSELKYLKYLLMRDEMVQEVAEPKLYYVRNHNSKEELDKHRDSIPHEDEDTKVVFEDQIFEIGVALPLLDQIPGGRTSTTTSKENIGTMEVGNSHRPTTSALNDIYHDGEAQKNEVELQNLVSGSEPERATSSQARKRSGPLGSYHRGIAIRMLKNYLTDLTALNTSLDENIQKRIDENQPFLEHLTEANQRDPNSPLTSQEENKLSIVFEDYETALSSALEDQDDDEDVPGVADRVPQHLYEARFSDGGYVESLISALDLYETQVGEFKKLLPVVRVFQQQCKNLIETLEPTAEKTFEQCHKALIALKRLEVDGARVSSDRQRNGVHFCFESLFVLAQNFELVVDLLRKCASENLHKTALELADLPPPPVMMSRRWSEFSLAIRNCEWSMDLVEFAFYTLEKLLAGATYIFQDVSFKWCEEKSRMVLQIQGILGRQDSRLEKSLLDVSKELEKKDMDDLIHQLEHLGNSANGSLKWKLSGFSSKAAYDMAHVAHILSEKLSGPIPHMRYLPWTFRVDPDTLKFREYFDSGGAGMVGKCSWFGEDVAVKSVRSPDLTRDKFEEEAATLATVQHPNVVRLIGCGFIDKEENKTGQLVMELMDHDLRKVIESRIQELEPGSSPFTTMVAIDIIMQIAQAMKHLRDHKVLHRSLKAKNVLVNVCKPLNSRGESTTSLMRRPDLSTVLPQMQENYVAKLADFGFGKCRPHSSSVRTRMAVAAAWRAPEVFHVRDTEVTQEYGWPADVYSFAMTCYEILTGNLPFEDLSNQSIHESIVACKRPEGLDELEIPELLKELVKKCWATNPEERPTFEEIVKALWQCRVKATVPIF